MQNMFTAYGFLPTPGMRDCFYRRLAADEWLMMGRIPDDFVNTTPFADELLAAGLYAVTTADTDDMEERFALLHDWINKSRHFAVDTMADGRGRCPDMFEELTPWDIAMITGSFRQDLYVPVRLQKERQLNEESIRTGTRQ